MLSDTTAKSIIYQQRQNQDPPPNYNRRSMPSNVAQNSPSVNEGWKTTSSGSNQTPSIGSMENRNDYWQKTPQFQPQYQQQNVLQTTAMFHELENKLDKVRYFCEQIKAIAVDPSTVLEWNAERYNSLTSLATSLRGSVENLSKTPVNPQYAPQSTSLPPQTQFQSQPIPNQPSLPPQQPNRTQNEFANQHFRGNYPVQNQNYDYYQQSPQLMSDMVTDNANTPTSNGNNNGNPSSNNTNNAKYQPNGIPPNANVSTNIPPRDTPQDAIDPKNAQTMMASFPPNKSYEVVWAQPDQKQRRPRKKRKLKEDDS